MCKLSELIDNARIDKQDLAHWARRAEAMENALERIAMMRTSRPFGSPGVCLEQAIDIASSALRRV